MKLILLVNIAKAAINFDICY